jgi:hypothetical protein
MRAHYFPRRCLLHIFKAVLAFIRINTARIWYIYGRQTRPMEGHAMVRRLGTRVQHVWSFDSLKIARYRLAADTARTNNAHHDEAMA